MPHSKTQVFHVITAPIGGGAEYLVRELNRRLPEQGINSCLIFLSSPDAYVLDEREYSLGAHSPRHPKNIYLLWQFFRRHKSLLNNGDQVIIHSHLTWPLYYTVVAFLFSQFKLFYTEHSTYNSRRKLFGIRLLEKAIYGRYLKIICISEGVRNSLRRWLACSENYSALTVIHNGSRFFELKPKRQQREDGKLELISIGTIAHRKGFDIVLSAIAEKRDLIRSYTIIGIGPDENDLRVKVGELGLSDTVKFVGWIDNPEKYLHSADIAVVPSRWEGFGLAAVEALSAGLPVIASDVDGLREVLTDTDAAILIPPENYVELASAIEKVHMKLMQGHDYRSAARMQAMKFSFDTMVKKYAGLYKTV